MYTLRGKYKQYFLRTSEDGTHVCQPANLKVTPERTLEIFIEDVSYPFSNYPFSPLAMLCHISWAGLLTCRPFSHHAEPFAYGTVLPPSLAPHPQFSPTRPTDA